MRSSSARGQPDWRAPLAALAPIGLSEVRTQAGLQDRMDTKYLVTAAQLAALLERLGASHRVLEIDGRRAFEYRTTYYDTDDLLTFREHVQRRRRRFKCRKRRYVDSGLSDFEVKLKGTRERTVKHARPCDPAEGLGDEDLAFLRDRLHEAYGRELREPLRPSLVVTCRRVTLAAPQAAERVTCDIDLHLGCGRLAADLAVVETKSVDGASAADRVLRELGARPVERFSKYLLGVALNRDDVRDNDMRPLLRRHFERAAR
jgi:hypothetical protein